MSVYKNFFRTISLTIGIIGIFQALPVFADNVYESQFGGEGSANGELYYALGLGIDASDNIYVADSFNYRIQKFNSAGVYQSQFGSNGSGNGQFNTPTDVAFDSAGNIYVADRDNHRIQKFNSSGVYQSQFGTNGSGNGQFSSPGNIAIDSADNIYVADRDNHRIQKFNSSGVYQSQFGTNGSGNGQFDSPNGITFDSAGNIYVADSNNNRIQKFNSAGVYQSQFGSSGDGDGEFDYPNVIAIDSYDSIYVTDSNNDRIQKFNSAGVYQSQFGTNGSGNGEVFFPAGIAVDSLNNVYVVDSNNSRVQKFTGDAPLADPGDSEEEVNEEPSSRAKITSFSVHSILTSFSPTCPQILKLAIKGRHLSDDTSVRIGENKAKSVVEVSSKQVIAKFCINKLKQKKEEVSVRNDGEKRSTAQKKFDVSQIVLRPSPGATFNPNIKEGIVNIQKLLVIEKLLLPSEITGIYDNRTFNAVKAFQIKNGLSPTGKINSETTKVFRNL